MKSPRTSSRTNPSATTSGSKKSKTLSSTAKNPTKRGVSASPARSIASPAAKKKTPAKAATPSRASRSSSLPSRQTPQKTPVRASSPRASAKKEKSQVKSSPASSQKKSVKEVKEQSKEKTATKKYIKEPSKKLSVRKKESSSKEDLPGRQTNANKDTPKNTAKQGQGKQEAPKEKAKKSESRSSRSRNRKSPTPEDCEDSSSEEETVVRRRSSKSSQKDNGEKSKPKVHKKVLKSKIDSKSAKSNSDRQSEVDESDESEEEDVKAAPKGRRLSSRSNQKNGNGDSQTPEKKNEAKAAENKTEAKVGEKKNDAKAAEKKTEAKAGEKKNEGQTAGKKNGVKNTETINEDEANTAEKKNETKTTDSNSNVEATSDETAMVIDDEAKKATKPVSVHIVKLNATELGAMVRTDVNAKQIEITASEDDDDDIISEGSVVELDDSSEGSVEEISSDDYVSSGEDDVVFSEDEIDPRQFVHVRILNQKLETMEVNHAMQLKKKNEALERLKNELKWKEEQLSEMNNITVKNIELESKISAMLSDSKIYQEEVTKWKETNRSKDEEVAKNSVKSKDIAEKVVKSKEVVKSKAVAEKSVKSKEVAEKTVKSKEVAEKTVKSKEVAEKVDNSKEVPEKSVKKKSEGKETEKEDKVKQTKQKEKSEVKEKKVEKKADRASSRKRQRKESSSNEESANEEEMETEVETRSSPRKKDAKGKGKQETPKKVAKSKEDKQKKKGKGAEDSQKKEEKREATPRRRSRRNKEENESDEESDTKEQSEESEDEEEKSEKDGKKKSRKRKRSTPARKGKKGKRRRKKKSEEDESSEEEEDIDELFVSKKDGEEDSDIQIIEDSDAEDKGKKNKSPKKKTVSKDDVKDDEDKGEEEDEDDDDDDKDGKGRHNIRKLLTGKKLTEETKAAAKAEKDRRERALKEHDKHLVVQEEDPNSPHKICTKLVLSFKEGTKQPLVEVLPKLVKKLKPHQVEAVEFMWDNLVESVDKLKAGHPGQGCILAHCMGLGKTLSVITLVHTMLKSKAVGLKCCMVVCPLNTVLNWQFEWTKWLDKKERVPTYELASCKGNHDRAELLNKWKKSGGIMIIGYSLFRILASYTGKSKKVKAAFDAGLLDPGPDIVICDEGHILKNDASALSKWMSKIKSQRRVVLTGTPLQNNLVEYHCMTNFVKPQLLGTRKEFCNRFVNPITNGQHSDSTSQDVKLMKRRAHVLHEMLAGCVQRRDYSALTKFLPSKNEYVISVRLSKLQIELYQKYLDTFRAEESKAANQTFEQFKIRGASLFTDYQALMRVWTHPWVLKLDAQRQEKKAFNEQDDELDSLDEESDLSLSESEEESVSKDSDSEEDMDVDGSTSDSNSSGGKRKTRGKKTEAKKSKGKDKPKEKSRANRAKSRRRVSNDDDDSSKNTTETESNGTSELEEKAKVLAGEVIRTWKTTSRHGKQDAVNQDDLVRKDHQWWTDLVDEEKYKKAVEVSGKLVLLFEVLRMAEGLGDKVLVFSQSILSLDLIEEFLKYKTEEAEKYKGKKADKPSKWIKDEDYYRMDGTTGAQNRRKFTSSFNTDDNDRLRLFLISTRAGGLGINLDSANRVIIFDASWNPSHDIQSIFRVYRFGQKKPVQVYRFVAQGTMEEKIYERQVAKETLSQRVIDEHQIDRHFTANDLKELYIFKPDRLDDPERIEPPVPKVPSDLILAELLTEQKDWIYGYHEHDSLLENRPDENLSEEERKAAWADYERDKQGLYNYSSYTNTAQQQPATNLMYRAPILNSYLTGPHLRPQGFTSTYTQPQINMQLQQLPRVVKEILKYNPNITAGDLQNRLQSFLGMHGKFAIPPGPGGTAGQPIRITTLPSASNSASGSRSNTPPVINMALPQALPAQGFWPTTSARPAQGFMSTSAKPAQGFMSSVPRLVQASFQPPPSIPTLFPGSLPSRLPNTGRVPAMHPIPGTSSGASTPPGTGASSLGAGDSSSKPAAAAATSSAT